MIVRNVNCRGAICTAEVVCIRRRVKVVGKWINATVVYATFVVGVRKRIVVVCIHVQTTINNTTSIFKICKRVEIGSNWICAAGYNTNWINSIAIFIDSISADIKGTQVYAGISIVAVSENAHSSGVIDSLRRACAHRRKVITIAISIEVIR